MSTFKELRDQDLNVFFNPEEFGELHAINGKPMVIIVDDERLKERIAKEFQGVTVGEILYQVPASVYGVKPKINERQMFDTRLFYVFDAKLIDGLYEIILSKNIGGYSE